MLFTIILDHSMTIMLQFAPQFGKILFHRPMGSDLSAGSSAFLKKKPL
jgi:hypothetical protein